MGTRRLSPLLTKVSATPAPAVSSQWKMCASSCPSRLPPHLHAKSASPSRRDHRPHYRLCCWRAFPSCGLLQPDRNVRRGPTISRRSSTILPRTTARLLPTWAALCWITWICSAGIHEWVAPNCRSFGSCCTARFTKRRPDPKELAMETSLDRSLDLGKAASKRGLERELRSKNQPESACVFLLANGTPSRSGSP